MVTVYFIPAVKKGSYLYVGKMQEKEKRNVSFNSESVQ